MRNRFLTRVTVAAHRGAALPLAVTLVTAQTPGYRAPRAPDGKPNLNGIWQAINTANWDIEAHSAAPESGAASSGAAGAVPAGLGVVEGGDAAVYARRRWRRRKENLANRLKLDPEIKCYLPGVPRATYMPFPFQIIQSQKHIMIVHEYAGAVRTIYMDNQTEAPADSWMGWSNGRWEGETLVVDTKGFNDLSWFDRAGQLPQRCAARGRAHHGAQRRDAELRGDDRGSQGLHAALEDEHAALPPRGAQRADSGIQVRRIRGRSDLRASAETAESVSL